MLATQFPVPRLEVTGGPAPIGGPPLGLVLPAGARLRLSLGWKSAEALILGDMLRRADGGLAEITCLSRLSPESGDYGGCPVHLVEVPRNALAPGIPDSDLVLCETAQILMPGGATPIRAGDVPGALRLPPDADGAGGYLIGLNPAGPIRLAGLLLDPAPLWDDGLPGAGPVYSL